MSNQLVPVFQQYFNADGDAEAGLVLHTYIAGTLNDKETFQTYAGTANTNPIIMNASGYPPAGIYGTGTYRFILKDSEGTTLRDQDNVVLTEGLQPDADGNYVIPDNLDVQGQMTIDDMVITADGVAIWTLGGAEVMRIDANGNIAYNGATIPNDLDPNHKHIFYSDETALIVNSTGVKLEAKNAYVALDGTAKWKQTNGSNSSSLITTTELVNEIQYSGSGAAFPIMWVNVYSQDLTNGNINIKTGGTYTATL